MFQLQVQGFTTKNQCFSYRRFFASLDASSLIWTQVERFGRFFQVQFSMRLLRVEPPKSKSKYRVSTEEWTVNSLFPACLWSTQMCFQPFVLWQAQQLFCPSGIPRQSRGFSTQNRILKKLRNRLLEGTLDQLMRICIRKARQAARWIIAGLRSCGDLSKPAAVYELVFGAHGKLSPATVGLCLYLQQL